MLSVTKHLIRRTLFDNDASLHNGNAFAGVPHNVQIVSNEEQGEPLRLLEIGEKIQNLGSDGYIQCTDWFVCDKQSRPRGESPGNGDALALAPREFMRLAPRRACRHPDGVQQFFNARFDIHPHAERSKWLGHDVEDIHAPVHGIGGILHDDLNASTQLS